VLIISKPVVQLKERDYLILENLAKLRLMTVQQIYRLYFESNSSRFYCYERMKNLEKAGLVTSRPYVSENGRKIGVCYYLTNHGYDELDITISKNASEYIIPRQHKYRVSLSELYVQLTPVGWLWFDSREAKKAYGFNRNRKISGVLRRYNAHALTGYEDFGVYLLSDAPLYATIEKIQKEIMNTQMSQLHNFIILHFGSTNMVSYKGADEKINFWHEETLGAMNLLMMNYHHGLKYLKYIIDPDYILKPPFALKDLEYKKREPGPFSSHIAYYRKANCYLVDLTVPNLSTLSHLKKYGLDRAKTENRGVLIFVNPSELNEWVSTYEETHPHFRFIPVEI
jgi:hypothetical protein